MSIAAFDSCLLGPRTALINLTTGTTTTYAMASLNTGWAVRFQARDTRDIYGVYLNWSSVATPGAYTLRIETDSSGKPSGTLYDANAVLTGVTPTAGWQLHTFGTPPSTNLVAGNYYYVVVLTTTGGTTQTLRSSVTVAEYPMIVLTAADGTTRTNFAEVTGTTPLISFILSDSSETGYGGLPFTAGSLVKIFGNAGYGMLFTVPTGETWSVAGAEFISSRVGSPTSDLKVSIYGGSSIVSGATVTMGNNGLLNSSTRNVRAIFPAPVTLAAGTYRLICELADHGGSASIYHQATPAVGRAAAVVPANFTWAGSSNVTAGTITWDGDVSTSMAAINLVMADLPAVSGGGINSLVGGGLVL